MFAWVIDKDHLDGADVGRHMAEPSGFPTPTDRQAKACADAAASLAIGRGRRFRLRDDDQDLYYEGRIVTDQVPGDPIDFAPLDRFGTPHAGCTEIQYLDGGTWTQL